MLVRLNLYHDSVVIFTESLAITPSTLPTRLNALLIKKLQCEVAKAIFTPKAVYDGRKNLFATHELALGPNNSREFDVTFASNPTSDRPPKIYKVKVTRVAEINPEVLDHFVKGTYGQDNQVLTAIMALNVVIRMEPNSRYPFNVRSFFTNQEVKNIGAGIELWRGYFQSIRPGVGRLLLNVDISTGMMYKSGPLIGLVLDFFGRNDPNILSPASGFPDRERLRLQRFLAGVRITTPHTNGTRPAHARVVKKLSTAGANSISFTMSTTNQTLTVAQYFHNLFNRPLRYPGILCVELGSGALVPFELCVVPEGQIMKKQVPSDKTKDVVEFATKKPHERFNSIRDGLGILAYGQSDYVRDFGLTVETTTGLLPIQARVLNPPKLQYGRESKQPTITPRDGAWNMIDKRFFRAATINRWLVVSFADKRTFPEGAAQDMVRGFLQGCRSVGMAVNDETPFIKYLNGQGRIGEVSDFSLPLGLSRIERVMKQLRGAGAEVAQKKGSPPDLVVVVLPEGGNDIYTAVKYFGDIQVGVATQCLKAIKCRNAKPQYWANVCLKMNVKLGGINLIPDPQSVSVLTDPHNPTVVMGADVIHPAPGSEGRPSFTAVVGNVDSHTAKYIATTCVQTSRQEMIDDLKSMCTDILKMYIGYRTSQEKQAHPNPKRLIFYRDGVSEGQFQQVLDIELPLIKAACQDLKISPKITLLVVGKRHHVRFLPQNQRDADRSGNCPAGLVVDKDICHPTEFDFYLQSHGGLIGTSRPAHYTVLYDENQMNADSMQALSFALCHVYARSTRSVSIPAPVYYADIVCSRAKHHYNPDGDLDLSDTATQVTAATTTLEAFKREYKPLHPTQARRMYFS
jgi:eukaryotic translation initiation factor 2C